MVISTLFLSFSLNIINHGNIFIGILNTLLLFFSINFYFIFFHKKLSFIKSSFLKSPFVVLTGAVPIFTRANDLFITSIAIGIILLATLCVEARFKKILIPIIIIYIIFGSFYANGLIKLPFSFQTHLLFFNDDWINLYITQMKTESQYMPYIIRSSVYNLSAHFYVILWKMVGFFTLKNIFDAFFIANIYPFMIGLISDLQNWNKLKTLFFCILLISLSMSVSRLVEINNTFLLLSPFLIYFILNGLNFVNKRIYIALLIISIFIAMGPTL